MPKKFFAIGLLVVAVGLLSYFGLQQATTYYYEISDFLNLDPPPYGETVRINGIVADIKRDELGPINFKLLDATGKEAEIQVIYQQGQVPDTFQEGTSAVVEGVYTSEGIFEAHLILPKCASHYEAKE